MPKLFAPISVVSAGVAIGSTMATPPANDVLLDTLLKLAQVAAYLVLVVLVNWLRRRQKNQQTRLETTEHKIPEPNHINKVDSQIVALENEQRRMNTLIDQLTTDLKETRAERDNFRDKWGEELAVHSKTKLALNEANETNINLTKINNEQYESFKELKKRFEDLERKIEAYEGVERLAERILAGMDKAVSAGVTAAIAALSPKITRDTLPTETITPTTAGNLALK